MDLNLSGKVALIFGASKGIGLATAATLAEEGARLALAARSVESFAGQDAPWAADSLFLAADLTQPGAAEAAVAATVARYGRIDALVVSAGAAQGGLFWELDDPVWEEALQLKFLGLVRAMRAVAPVLRRQGSGNVVAVVGNAGKQPNKRMLPGAAANAACLAIVRGLAEELAPHGVRVNAVNPGPTRTGRWTALVDRLSAASDGAAKDVEAELLSGIPLGRISEPEEVARIIAFLLSDTSGTITGTSVTADGGMTAAIA